MTWRTHKIVLYTMLTAFVIFCVSFTYYSVKMLDDRMNIYISTITADQIGYCILEVENVEGSYIIITTNGLEIIEGEEEKNRIIAELKRRNIYGKNYEEYVREQQLFKNSNH